MTIDCVVFDCDGTLSEVEGIDELARMNSVFETVSAMTERAMGETGITLDLYEKRLEKVQPSWSQLETLATLYYLRRTPDVEALISHCGAQGIAVFVVSAGLNPSVVQFCEELGVSASHVFAVDCFFDAAGHYRDFDRHAPTTRAGGKREVVQKLKEQYENILFVGDGKNDLEVKDMVHTFVGYGGAYYRPAIEAACEHYIKEPSIWAVVALLAK